jgi:hypothetical protein
MALRAALTEDSAADLRQPQRPVRGARWAARLVLGTREAPVTEKDADEADWRNDTSGL